jgi:hypothetical protein
VGDHLQAEALQAGTKEIYLQMPANATKEGVLKMMPGLRNAYPELRGVFVRIYSPGGDIWWSGTFGGPR